MDFLAHHIRRNVVPKVRRNFVSLLNAAPVCLCLKLQLEQSDSFAVNLLSLTLGNTIGLSLSSAAVDVTIGCNLAAVCSSSSSEGCTVQTRVAAFLEGEAPSKVD